MGYQCDQCHEAMSWIGYHGLQGLCRACRHEMTEHEVANVTGRYRRDNPFGADSVAAQAMREGYERGLLTAAPRQPRVVPVTTRAIRLRAE